MIRPLAVEAPEGAGFPFTVPCPSVAPASTVPVVIRKSRRFIFFLFVECKGERGGPSSKNLSRFTSDLQVAPKTAYFNRLRAASALRADRLIPRVEAVPPMLVAVGWRFAWLSELRSNAFESISEPNGHPTVRSLR